MSESPDSGTGSRGQRGLGSRVWAVATTVALILAAALAAVMLVPAALGLERYVITGDSMSGSIERGSVVLEEVVPVSELEVGDVITYEPPEGAGPEGLVTHRITKLTRRDSGRPAIRTEGDANASTDPWRFRLDAAEQARVVADVPYVGYVLAALGMREVRMALIGVPALLVGFALLAGVWREAGVEARRRRAAATRVDSAGGSSA